ncbi:MAG: NAD(P)-dependent oxidoreductase [Rhodospirillales bacterium]|nr:NAD(P)-dependent oxidoreductase [Rhodospirillales bacterium]
MAAEAGNSIMTKEIGFIGVGRMGGAMAGRLVDAGYRIHAFDARREAIAAIVSKGVVAASSPADVASKVETVLVSLPTPEIVKQVALGAEGVAEGTSVKTYVDLSTTGPRVAAEVAAALAEKGITTLDAPVSGGVGGARKGTLAVMVSGPRNLCGELRPMFEVIGRYFYIGDKPGMGQAMKLANNMLSATAMAASAEVMVMGVKAGLDPRVMIDVINAGSGANTAIRDKFPKTILTRSFDYGFATGLMYKDVKLCLDEAERLHTPMWVCSAVRQLWLEANGHFGPESDFTTIVQLVEQWAGVEVKAPIS